MNSIYEEEMNKKQSLIDKLNEKKSFSLMNDSLTPKISHLTILQRNINQFLENENLENISKIDKYLLVNNELISPLIDLLSLNLKKNFWNLKNTPLELLTKEMLKIEDLSSFVQLSLNQN